ncbi:hypothetical protein ElyMa_006430800 [Elysia marginata]|uniref:Uncharacterized protein n=1 Tax=Elysia marginata TaxID=1093978 RepID=A0AAV4HWG5_9GAST|nr:hypothetical protein ElyMa_006430800 [Elysia marginata]
MKGRGGDRRTDKHKERESKGRDIEEQNIKIFQKWAGGDWQRDKHKRWAKKSKNSKIQGREGGLGKGWRETDGQTATTLGRVEGCNRQNMAEYQRNTCSD